MATLCFGFAYLTRGWFKDAMRASVFAPGMSIRINWPLIVLLGFLSLIIAVGSLVNTK